MTITDGGVYVLTGAHANGNVTVSGGTIDIVSSDDGLSAAGGADQSGFGGRGRTASAATWARPCPFRAEVC